MESSQSDAGRARKTRSRAKLARVEVGASINSSGAAGGGALTEQVADDFGRAAARVVALGEDDIFRTIVGYL